jgi:ferrochelatase
MLGLLLVNLGTPDAPTTPAVRRYLREFLSDPRVIDLHPIARTLLLELVILPFRPAKSAEAYRKVWTPEGSPLLTYSRGLEKKVRAVMAKEGEDVIVELAMRYGNPSLESAVEKLRLAGAGRIFLAPLYPQYSSACTGSSVQQVFKVIGRQAAVPTLAVLPPFYDDPGFLAAFAARGREVIAREKPDHVLFSFHGLPERQVRASDHSGKHCLATERCCDEIGPANRDCYRAHCFATARGLEKLLGLGAGDSTVCFQSRLGSTPWIKPYTDATIDKLAKEGKKRLVVLCPAFVADCLETIEEIGLRAKEQFLEAGGESLALVPSLNDDDAWVEALVSLVRRNAGLQLSA